MRRAALVILATCLCVSAAPADDLDYSYFDDDSSGSDYGTSDDGGFYQELLGAFYEYGDSPAPGEMREYPRPYYEPSGDCDGDPDCFEPGDFLSPPECPSDSYCS